MTLEGEPLEKRKVIIAIKYKTLGATRPDPALKDPCDWVLKNPHNALKSLVNRGLFLF